MSVVVLGRSRVADLRVPLSLGISARDMRGTPFAVSSASLFRQDPDEPDRVDVAVRGLYREPVAGDSLARALYSCSTTGGQRLTMPANLLDLVLYFAPEALDRPADPDTAREPGRRGKAHLYGYEHTTLVKATAPDALTIPAPYGPDLRVGYVEITRRVGQRVALTKVIARDLDERDPRHVFYRIGGHKRARTPEIPLNLAALVFDHQGEAIPESITREVRTHARRH